MPPLAKEATRRTNVVVPPPAALRTDQYAFFLDLDGTLIDYAQRPDAVTIDAELIELLQRLTRSSGGATALMSGRSIASLDALLHPLRLAAAGQHGFERRSAAGVRSQHPDPSREDLSDARRLVTELAAAHPRLWIEDKGCAVAVHFRAAAHLEGTIVKALEPLASRTKTLRLQRGHLAIELTPRGVSKATAITEFMGEPPFLGRRPLHVGDDRSDEAGFECVNAAGGLSVAVGVTGQTAAQTHLASVPEVRGWLSGLLDASGTGAPRVAR